MNELLVEISVFFNTYKRWVIVIHILGVALGVGGATIIDILFFNFLKNLKISLKELNILRIVSKVVWIGLILLLISGVGLYLPAAERLNDSAKFLTKMIVVGVLILNGFVLNIYIFPKLVRISFGDASSYFRKLIFISGGVSIASWYSAFLLGAIRSIKLQFSTLLIIYIGVLCITICVSLLLENKMSKRSSLS